MKALLLYNPVSGNGKIKEKLSEIIDTGIKSGFDVEVYATQKPRDAMNKVIKSGSEFERIIAAGGDGMLHETLNGLMHLENPPLLGYIPSGTVNDFANTHNLSSDVEKAAVTAFSNEKDVADLGLFNGEFFSYVAAFGFGTQVSYDTDQELKNRFGYLAYLITGLRTTDFAHWENNCVTCKITADDYEFEGDFLFGAISNTRYIGGRDYLAGDNPDWKDGLMEGIFVRRPMNIHDLDLIARSILRKDFSSDYFVSLKASRFLIQAKDVAWTLDGEFGGVTSNALIETVPKALGFLSPADK